MAEAAPAQAPAQAAKGLHDVVADLMPSEEDLLYEEEILRNPFSLRMWLRYIEARKDAEDKRRFLLFERAIQKLPGSYKVSCCTAANRLLTCAYKTPVIASCLRCNMDLPYKPWAQRPCLTLACAEPCVAAIAARVPEPSAPAALAPLPHRAHRGDARTPARPPRA
jgi:hypothetical protein